MELRQNIRLKQQQKLIMSRRMLQSLDMLMLPLPELRTRIEQEMLSNPVIEEVPAEPGSETAPGAGESPGPDENWEYYFRTLSHQSYDDDDDGGTRSIESVAGAGESLAGHLTTQLHISVADKIPLGEYIIGNLDADGFLRATPAEICAASGESRREVMKMLKFLKSFDPPGVFASDLSECLLIQAVSSPARNLLAERIIKNYLPELKKKQLGKIASRLKADPGEVSEAARFISMLDPRPGASFSSDLSPVVTPDITVRKIGGGYEVDVRGEELPGLRVSRFYRKLMKEEQPENVKSFISKKIKAADWLIESISSRNNSLRKITEFILDFQKGFFDGSSSGLKPLRLKDAAEKTGLSESTVSRAVSGKYIETDRGIFQMKRFFSGSIPSSGRHEPSSSGVKDMIAGLVQTEPPGKPFSDSQIASLLREKGISIARRTVAKYRDSAGILPASLRKSI